MQRRTLLILVPLAALHVAAADPSPIAELAGRANADFTNRLEAATAELAAVRERITLEKAPLLEASRAAGDQIVSLGPEVAALESARAEAEERRRRLERDSLALRKNINYFNTLARDSLKSLQDGLLPGEQVRFSEKLAALSQRFEPAGRGPDPVAALDTVDLMLQRVREQLGGYTATGEALVGESNEIVPGTFAFLGPEVFFQSRNAGVAGTVRTREGSALPISFPLPAWSAGRATALFQGEPGTVFADPTGGKALRLRETTGTLTDHIRRGGPVAYLIIATGLFSLALTFQKFLELRKLTVDTPATVGGVLDSLFETPPGDRHALIERLNGTTRELFATGRRHLDKPKDVIEEHLFAFTLRTRLHYERRLPLLAVIATASPLMGLLGTVTGMIKTFALITVFGTGNATKLSSGISEVLVTTELGLAVAIPTLIAHGFLSHRAQKKLSLLERYAVEFVAASGTTRRAEEAGEPLSL